MRRLDAWGYRLARSVLVLVLCSATLLDYSAGHVEEAWEILICVVLSGASYLLIPWLFRAAYAVHKAGAFAVASFVESRTHRAVRYDDNARVQREQFAVDSLNPFPEPSGNRRRARRGIEEVLKGGRAHLTLGLAGRRGLGKTNLLNQLLRHVRTGRASTSPKLSRYGFALRP